MVVSRRLLVFNIELFFCFKYFANKKINLSLLFTYLFSVGVFRYAFRLVWDTAIFHLVIKKRGRIPASDSFVVRRVAGPGLASKYYYQASATFMFVSHNAVRRKILQYCLFEYGYF